MIRLEHGNVAMTMSEAQLANAVAAFNKEQLQDFVTDLNTSVPEILDLIQRDESGNATDLSNLSDVVLECLTKLSGEHKNAVPEPLAEQKLEILANYAESLDNKELETQLRNVGLLQHSSNLMR